MTLTYRPQWSGSRIGQGFTVFNLNGTDASTSTEINAAAAAIRKWFQSFQATIPDDVTISFPSEILVKDPSTMELEGVKAVTAPANVTGSFSSSYAANAGRLVKWQTGQVLGGRRITGRTFLVPSGGIFDVNGNVSGTVIGTDATAHTTLLSELTASIPLVVVAKGTVTDYVPVAVTSGATLGRPTNLRSRND